MLSTQMYKLGEAAKANGQEPIRGFGYLPLACLVDDSEALFAMEIFVGIT
jgi:hypothetical protein